MTICYFGNFDPNYARNRVIIRGLEENKVEVLLCRTTFKGFKGLMDLFKKHRDLKNKYDILIVGYSDSRFMVPLTKLVCRKPVVWDAFYSLYDSWVFDRKLVTPQSLKAKYYWFLDWMGCKLAHKISLDAKANIEYFVKTFGINEKKFIRVFVGTDPDLFYPRPAKGNGRFLIHFHGRFIPLQGIEYIVRAADLLRGEKDIHFRIIGSGQEYERMRELARTLNVTNINWINKVPYDKLSDYIGRADISLGIFGNTPKTLRVIPNKVYETIAMAKPVITADTPAIRELFTDRENVLLCERANPEDLTRKILELKEDLNLRSKIAVNGRLLFEQKCLPKTICRTLLFDLKQAGVI